MRDGLMYVRTPTGPDAHTQTEREHKTNQDRRVSERGRGLGCKLREELGGCVSVGYSEHMNLLRVAGCSRQKKRVRTCGSQA